VSCEEDAEILQYDLDRLSVWAYAWQMQYDVDKYAITHFIIPFGSQNMQIII